MVFGVKFGRKDDDKNKEEEEKGEGCHRPRRRRHDDGDGQHHQPHEGGSSGDVVIVKSGESIQDALDHAAPGCIIKLEAGTYHESIKSRVDGTKERPITIKGPKNGPTAIVKGDDTAGTCVEINHDYYVLDDFTIDGKIREPGHKGEMKECFRAKCLAIRGVRPHRALTKENGDRYVSAVDGCVVKNMKIYNCGGEGIRLRYFVTNTTIYHNRITSTGRYDFIDGECCDGGKKNGEGICSFLSVRTTVEPPQTPLPNPHRAYLAVHVAKDMGTSSKQWHQNPSDEPDISRFNHIYENYIDTHGNECVDVKEGTVDTIIETNYCTGQLDEDSGGIDSRANDCIIRYNKVVGCKGAGVRLGGHKVGRDQYGINCQVYCNILKDNVFAGIKVMTEPHDIYQNTISGPGHKYKTIRGPCAKSFEENCECPFDVDPPEEEMETSKWFQNCKP